MGSAQSASFCVYKVAKNQSSTCTETFQLCLTVGNHEHFTLVNYGSKVVITNKLYIFTTLES